MHQPIDRPVISQERQRPPPVSTMRYTCRVSGISQRSQMHVHNTDILLTVALKQLLCIRAYVRALGENVYYNGLSLYCNFCFS